MLAEPVVIPYNERDVMRAFSILAGQGAPKGCVKPEVLQRKLVSGSGRAQPLLWLLHGPPLPMTQAAAVMPAAWWCPPAAAAAHEH